MKGGWIDKIHSLPARAELFTKFLQALTGKELDEN
jgi:hypothetical protein